MHEMFTIWFLELHDRNTGSIPGDARGCLGNIRVILNEMEGKGIEEKAAVLKCRASESI